MAQICKICNHDKRLDIDREIARGISKTQISNKYNVPRASVEYHARHHLSHQLTTAFEKKELMEGLDLLNEIEGLLTRTKRIMDQAESENKLNTALRAIGEARSSYELLSKIAFSLHQARIAELELEQQKNKKQDDTEPDEAVERIFDRLNKAETDVFMQLTEKINGFRDDVIFPGPDNEPLQASDSPPRYYHGPESERVKQVAKNAGKKSKRKRPE